MRLLAFAILGCVFTPTQLLGQEVGTRADSLEREIRLLKTRVDSLQQLLLQLIRESRDTAEVVDELAALRAAARAAADETRSDVDSTATQHSRTQNLSALNPEISVTGDVVAHFTAPNEDRNRVGATARELEFSFQSALDPHTRTKIFAAYEEEVPIAGFPEEGHDEHGAEESDEGEEGGHGHGEFHIEEAYAYWVRLPGSFGLKAGRFRQEIGLYNRWHTHALWEVDRPLASVVFLGHDGLIQTGVGLTLPTLITGPGTQTLFFEATSATNEALFEHGGDFSLLGRLQSFWDVSSSAYFQVGATGVYGENRDESLESRLLGLDFAFRWAPPNRALYQAFHLKGEWYFSEKEEPGERVRRQGGYAQANYRLNRRFILGVRGDYLQGLEEDPAIIQVVPSLTWWQSEWVYLRLQYNHLKHEGEAVNHTLMLQLVWAIGPHKHETY
jgi:hypothetical protein